MTIRLKDPRVLARLGVPGWSKADAREMVSQYKRCTFSMYHIEYLIHEVRAVRRKRSAK